MASAARAYQPYSYAEAYQQPLPRAPRTYLRPPLHTQTRPQRKTSAQTEQSTQTLYRFAVFLAIIVFVIAVFSGIHVLLDSASVSLSVEAQQVSNNLVDARYEGSLLEVEVSTLSNPTRVQNAAQDLGMISPDNATVILLGHDVVVTNAQGELSLAGSLQAVVSGA